MKRYSIAIHGGAGNILQEAIRPELEKQYRQALSEALDCGLDILAKGGTSLQAVEEAVVVLEDCPLFNAGRGAVFTHEGKHEMDAAIMSGQDLQAGAVSLVSRIRNPVRLARLVMQQSPHVLIAGAGAEAFAVEQGMTLADEHYFYTDLRFQQWQQAMKDDSIFMDHNDAPPDKFGTVGAVALDQSGHLAAATSTGGMTNKRPGRIGDSPIPGAGTYANDETCAISCTGAGEFFIRSAAAFQVHALMKHAGLNLMDACYQVIHEIIPSMSGVGGLIAVDREGRICLDFNTSGMFRAFADASGDRGIEIYR